jgi:hypothetical protein
LTDRSPTTLEPLSIAPEAMVSDELSGIRSPALTFDVQKYQRFVEDPGLSESQQQELLTALWAIIVGFVDLGFNLHAVQQATNEKTLVPDSSRVLDSERISPSKKLAAAARFDERAERTDS